MLSEKKKRSDLGLDIFLPKSRCSLKKKKKKVFTPNRPLSKSKTVYAVFEGGTASFASPNIHHCRGIEIHRLRKVKTGFAKRAEIPRTGSLNVPKFQERVRANPCEPPESHHCIYTRREEHKEHCIGE